ncbi:MAG TPA: tRNA (adenosine(37)-N6)-threonylcarbamoyltransferase complex ATPase subunit type 1 TsaE [Hyphomicrobiaceae bacterium]|nr:tRNA (adenosine(37)-N6)-threonylcarbamoyltransferase complex ATPase subunit type 1 TsaE [Hyphomicrobiaceae bacterium]
MEWTRHLDEAGVVRLAELLALKIRSGDLIALSGDLGAGKTTLARALIGAVLRDSSAEVPSPTFSLHQTYVSRRLTIAHFDFYRLSGAHEVAELGFEDAAQDGAVIVEWPERAAALLPETRIEVVLAETSDPDVRCVTLRGLGGAGDRVARVADVMTFLDRQARWSGARITYLQGDASTRGYARLSVDGRTALLMDAPRQPDGPPVRDGKPYSQIAHLAEDMVRAFAAIAEPLRAAGLSAPEVLAEDFENGLLLVEDLGDRVFSVEVTRGAPQDALWRAAVDALVELQRSAAPQYLPLRGGSHILQDYDRAALQIEVELLIDWYWPALHGGSVPDATRAEFLSLWSVIFDGLERQPAGWVLRDFHSPNLIWLPERGGIRRVGLLDFQDAQRGSAAYDLVSLLQDARVDVAETLEKTLLAHYCEAVRRHQPHFDEAEFIFAYNALGAQRNTKILGIFVRLAHRDGKQQYLAHLPRIWGYLQRNLRHVTLAPLAAWYEKHFPMSVRDGKLPL